MRGGSLGKTGMWIFLATDAMGFGGLLFAYAVLRTRAPNWPDPAQRFDRGLAGALTFILLVSGATMTSAVAAAREGNRGLARALVGLTIVCGLVFVGGQVTEFQDLVVTRRLGLTADHAAALFLVIAGYHGLHALVGVLVLLLVAWRARGARDAASAARRWEVASLYWQFVDVVWIVIFTALYLLPPPGHGS